MLNCVEATKGQIDTIVVKYLDDIKKEKTECSLDSEDNVYFIKTESVRNNARLEWQARNSGTPSFFGLIKGQTRYDVNYPEGELYDKLTLIGAAAIKDWKAGNHL